MKDPVHFACPHIDKVLGEIDKTQRWLSKISDCDSLEEAKEIASRAELELFGTNIELEKVRSIASQLRDSRNGLQERLDEITTDDSEEHKP